MDNHHDAQVQAFITAINRCGGDGYADVQYAGNGEFIIDGVVNVRAALDAAFAAERPWPLKLALQSLGELRVQYSPPAGVSINEATREAAKELVRSALVTAPPPQQVEDAVMASGQKLVREYRPSMDTEVLHLWASDAVKVIRVLIGRAHPKDDQS